MKFEIKNRWNGSVQYSCELSAELAGKSYGLQLGFAIKQALAAKVNMSGSNLSGSDLRDSDLSGSDLRGSDLRDSNLRGSNLRDSNLSGSDLRGSDLSGSNLRDSDLSGSDLRGSDLSGCPIKILNIHQAVYEAASRPEGLEMGSWHTCETTHCRAGWVVHLAGEGGRALEWALGTPAAAAVIYMTSDPTLERIPDFYSSNSEALEDMRRLASET